MEARSRGQEQQLGAAQTQVWSESQQASEKMRNSRWGLAAGAQVQSLKPWLSGAGCSAKLEAGMQSPGRTSGRKRLHQRSNQLLGLLPSRPESRHSAGGAWLPRWFSSGLPWSGLRQHCWLRLRGTVTAAVGTEAGAHSGCVGAESGCPWRTVTQTREMSTHYIYTQKVKGPF